MKKLLGLLATTLILSSCTESLVLDEMVILPEQGWHMDSAVAVSWEPQSSGEPIYMSMSIRHLTDFPYNNLYLFRAIESTEGVEYTDTVNIALADELGVWNGSGMSTLKALDVPIGKGAVRFREDERYTLSILHGMRDTTLSGIQDVRIKFERASQE